MCDTMYIWLLDCGFIQLCSIYITYKLYNRSAYPEAQTSLHSASNDIISSSPSGCPLHTSTNKITKTSKIIKTLYISMNLNKRIHYTIHEMTAGHSPHQLQPSLQSSYQRFIRFGVVFSCLRKCMIISPACSAKNPPKMVQCTQSVISSYRNWIKFYIWPYHIDSPIHKTDSSALVLLI